MSVELLDSPPLFVGAGALYPYSDDLLESLSRITKFDEPYSLGRVIGTESSKRILVPRNMAPPGGLDLRTQGRNFKFKSKFKPRDEEQSRIIDETMKLLDEGRNFMISAPTGVGKTWMAMEIIARVGKKTLVIVTKDDVKDQWAEAAQKLLGLDWGKGIGLIRADNCVVVGQGLVIAFVQSIAKDERYSPQFFEDFGLVIVDECHRIGADFFSQAMYRSPAKLRIGLSATTDRSDGKGEVLEAHLGPVMVKSTLVAMKARVVYALSPWKLPMVPRSVKNKKTGIVSTKIVPLPHSPTQCGHVIKLIANHHARNTMICHFALSAYKKGRHTLVQTDTLEHLETLLSLFASHGVPPQKIGWYKAGQTKAERDKVKLLPLIGATYKMTAEATDIPRLDTLIMATPKADVRQIVGRILRTHPDKFEPLVFDIIDATSNLYSGYWRSRKNWYLEQGFEMDTPGQPA